MNRQPSPPTQPPPGWPVDPDVFPPGHPDAPPRPVEKPLPGMVWALAPNGERVLAYLPPQAEKAPDPAAPKQPDVWPLRLATGGGAVAAVLGVIGHYGPGLSQAGHAAEMAGIGVAAAAAGTGALVMLVKGSLSRQSGTNVNVSVNVTNTAHGGNATATARGRR